ncbi:RNA cytidine acetyltransferase [Melia azedarach]|uniref:RNA cytidine acetyltransferase n=1 Tax=Melia azedarach TaxID=155640 RepID=A0ACC1YCL1_MELAZ|nr:RNA cytidine acetyltransferase [Melia azedarach]
MRKKVDDRIRILIENGVKSRHRSMFVIIGDKSRDQIVNLHYMLSKAVTKRRPTVLWAYEKELDISSHERKRSKQLQKLKLRGLIDPEKADAFLLFLHSVSHCLYKDSERILGNTYGMCILQDFESLTPNLLARTIESVEGGGIVVLLLHTLSSLTSLSTMVMDIHKRFRTESHSEIVPRFNERFLLSLASCKACLVVDDELNILPISSHVKSLTALPTIEGSGPTSGIEKRVKRSEGASVRFLACWSFGWVVYNIRSGKSSTLGLAIAGAVAAGLSNIYVTAPTPQNLKSLFEFVHRGLKALQYEENLHFTLEKRKEGITQVNIYKQHRQTIKYILPHHHGLLSQVDLLVIDEAAAIPLPVVKSLLGGPYLVILSSTVSGYEGTGRSLSLKLLSPLEKQDMLFHKVDLKEAIRYASGDPLESWLNGFLCLDFVNYLPPINRFPHPSECCLYYVNRDTLFSFHKESEVFLQRMVALFVSSHYKNSPNDLQLMADAPAHHLFVLLGPVDESNNILPDILCVIQVCLEGQISRDSAFASLERGHLPSGDQIPWKFCEEFSDVNFATLSGARVVRIAVHPSAMGNGYGSTALKLLTRYYDGHFAGTSEVDSEKSITKVSLLEETIAPRENLPPLLVHLQDRLPEKIDYIGASFGVTRKLFNFWKKLNFAAFYLCEKPNDITGEHSCMVLKPLNTDKVDYNGPGPLDFLTPYYKCFKKTFIRCLPLWFRELDPILALSILDPKLYLSEDGHSESSENESLMSVRSLFSEDDFCLLNHYCEGPNKTSHDKVRKIVPVLAQCYFEEKIPVRLSNVVQACILLCMGLQCQDMAYIEVTLGLERDNVKDNFRKMMKTFHKYLSRVFTNKEAGSSVGKVREGTTLKPHHISLEADLDDGAKQVMEKMKMESIGNLNSKSLQQFSILGREAELEQALGEDRRVSPGGIISVKASRNNNTSLGRGKFDLNKNKKRKMKM